MKSHFLIAMLTMVIFRIAPAAGQFVLDPLRDIPFSDGEKQWALPWGGGLNAAQYNKADLNGDGVEELIIYDRSAKIYLIFKIENQKYVPASELFVLLPPIPDGWVLFVDYDGDGKKDIFSNGDRGIIVFKNIGQPDQPVQWKKVADPLFTTGFSGKINLIANSADVPAIADIDSDGDIDILVYNFAIGGYIRYNKNLSMELYGHADSLEFEINTRSWGEFEECDCNIFAFSGETCADLSGGRVMHPGGKALLAFDADGDGDKDLLVGHEQCIELYFYENMGDKDSAYMVDFSNMFPETTTPANFHVFPAGYYEDLDFDGIKDLIVTPSFEENYDFKIDFAHSNWFYKNSGTDDNPTFSFQQNNFLQGEGLDFGENSVPACIDLNADGKSDFLVAANGYWNGDNYSGYVVQVSNIGSPQNPSFVVASYDYLQLSSLNLLNPIINLVDFNGDGAPDLIYTGTVPQNFKLESWVFLNNAAAGAPVDFNFSSKTLFTLPATAGPGDSPAFADVDGDGYIDLLLGKRNGALEYYRNKSDNSFELIDGAFLGIERDFSQQRLNLVASVVDVDLDGKHDLIVTDATGEGKIYFEFKDWGTNADFVELAYQNSVTAQNEKVKFDSRAWVTAADLFGLGSQSLIIGGIRGGLQFFKNNETGSAGNDTKVEVKLYPNPVFQSQNLSIKSNRDVTIELISLLGQRLSEPFMVRKYNMAMLDVSHLVNGPYILRSVASDGVSSAQLLLIQR